MKSIYFFMRYSRRFVILAVLTGIISGLSSTGLLALVNTALKSKAYAASTLMMVFVALCIVIALSRIASELLLSQIAQKAMYELRLNLCNQVLRVPLRRLEEIGMHRILTTITDDVPAITNAVASIPVLCINSAIVVGCLVYLGFLSWMALPAMLVFMVLGTVTYQFAVLKGVRYFKAARTDGDHLFHHFQSLTGGIKELKLNRSRREAFTAEVLEPAAASFKKHNLQGQAIYTVAASWGQLLSFIVIGLLIFVLPVFLNISEQVLTGYALALLFMTTPLQGIMLSAPSLGRANVALNNMDELGLQLSSHSTEVDQRSLMLPRASWRSLDLIDVSHQYRREGQEHNFTLGPVNINFAPGEIVFITGGNGSGKTTFAKMLAGLYAPEMGEIRLDGQSVTDQNRVDFREHFSTVFSDFHLFDSLLGLSGPKLDYRAHDYLVQLQLDHKVKIKDGKLSTVDLSQGQRKRLALLTAFLEDRPIYLFDEWAADQDPTFKKFFYYELLQELKSRGKTVFVISHDDSYFDVADRLLKFENGNLVSDSDIERHCDELAIQVA